MQILIQCNIICSKSTKERLEQYVKKSVQSKECWRRWCSSGVFIVNRFHTLLWCFHCWLGAGKCLLRGICGINLLSHSQYSCFPTGIYLLKVINANTRTMYETCSKLTIVTSMMSFWCLCCQFWIDFTNCSGVSILPLNKLMPTE